MLVMCLLYIPERCKLFWVEGGPFKINLLQFGYRIVRVSANTSAAVSNSCHVCFACTYWCLKSCGLQ